jgi:hypothetical protein
MKPHPSLRLLVFVPLFALLTACVTQSTATKAPQADLKTLKTFYVVKIPADGRGVNQVVADQLAAMGFQATTGEAENPAEPVDAIVTYQDKWMWDMTMYMIQLDIQLRAPDTRMVLASGSSLRTSLARKSPPEMAKEVLTKIFSQP